MDLIVIKHYIADLDIDYREINMSKIADLIGKMKKYAKESGKELFYAAMSENLNGFPAKSVSTASVYALEVSTTSRLNFCSSSMYSASCSEKSSRALPKQLPAPLMSVGEIISDKP